MRPANSFHSPLRTRLRTVMGAVASVACAALVAVGCGPGSRAPGESGMNYVPQDALGYVVIDTDFDGDSWESAHDLLDAFKGYDDFRDELASELSGKELSYDKDIEPWLGNEAGIAVLDLAAAPEGTGEDPDGTFFFWAEVDDEDSFRDFIKDEGEKIDSIEHEGQTLTTTRMAEGSEIVWTMDDSLLLLSDEPAPLQAALDARESDERVEGDETHEDAGESVPDDSLLSVYVSGEGGRKFFGDTLRNQVGSANLSEDELKAMLERPRLAALEAVAFGVVAEERGVRLQGAATYDSERLGDSEFADPTELEMIGHLPADTIAAFAGRDLGSAIAALTEEFAAADEQFAANLALGQVAVGLTVDDVARALQGEFAAALVPGAVRPAVALAVEASDEAHNSTVMKALVTAAASTGGQSPTPVDSGAYTGHAAAVSEGLNLTAVTGDGTSIITTDDSFPERYGADADETLASARAYTASAKEANVPEQLSGEMFVNTQAVLSLLEQTSDDGADIAGAKTKPLGPLHGWTTWSDSRHGFELFLQIDG